MDERGVTDFVEAAFQQLIEKTYMDGMIMPDTLIKNKTEATVPLN